jgi:hypothetical protein
MPGCSPRIWFGAGIASGDPQGLLIMYWSYLPAVLIIIGLAALLIG